MAEKNNTKADKDSIIQLVLSTLYYQDAEVPVTSFLLVVVHERNWTGGEGNSTVANCMKGLSIFAMKDISNEVVSRMNKEEEAKDKAMSTSSVKDHLLSTKWRPEVPLNTAELLKYFERYVNVLSALSMGQNPHCHHAKQIVGKLKRWTPSACKAMKREMIASTMWVTLKEARCSFMDIDPDVLPEFNELLDCLDKKKEFVVLDLPAALVKLPAGAGDTPAQGTKRRMEEVDEGKKQDEPVARKKLPRPDKKVGMNDIIKEKCGSLLKVIKEHKVPLAAATAKCNTRVAHLFPGGMCGQSAFFGHCWVCGCQYRHEKLQDKVIELGF